MLLSKIIYIVFVRGSVLELFLWTCAVHGDTVFIAVLKHVFDCRIKVEDVYAVLVFQGVFSTLSNLCDGDSDSQKCCHQFWFGDYNHGISHQFWFTKCCFMNRNGLSNYIYVNVKCFKGLRNLLIEPDDPIKEQV